MPVPTFTKTWTISPNNRIPFVSLNNTMANYLFGIKVFLKANGYVVKGSCDGTTGAMDAVDRWVTAANVTTRGAAAANAQSWVVLTDGNAANILLTFQGATDDIARISFSNSGVFVAAGTPNQQPTATDEAVVTSATSIIAATASQDRIWFGWVDSQSKLCRFAIARNGLWTGTQWGIEVASSVVTGGVVVWTPAVWGHAITGNVMTNSAFGKTRVEASAVGTTVNMGFGVEIAGNEIFTFNALGQKLELQGGTGFSARALAIGGSTVGARGKYADVFDWWFSRYNSGTGGDLFGKLKFIGVMGGSASGALVWPWDSVTTPVMI